MTHPYRHEGMNDLLSPAASRKQQSRIFSGPRDFLLYLPVGQALSLSAHKNSKRTPSETFATASVCSEPPKPAGTPSPRLSPYSALRPAFTSQETVPEMSDVALTSGPPRFVWVVPPYLLTSLHHCHDGQDFSPVPEPQHSLMGGSSC